MRRFASRRPFAFSVLVTLALFGLDLTSRAVFPRTPVANIEKLPQDAFEPPVGLGLILSDMRSPDTLFWALATVLALGLLVWTGWSGEGVAIRSSSMYRSAISYCSARLKWWRQPRPAWTARTMFSRTVRSSTMPSALRSSGQSATPRPVDPNDAGTV